jgi:uncharacterized repeat protein (TIGR03803 family)
MKRQMFPKMGEDMKRLTVSCLALAAAALASPALAQESVLYDFNSSSGAVQSRLLLYKNALYGTTQGYGNDGTVFQLKQVGGVWKESTIATFDGTNGDEPMAGLIADSSGNLYGTTFQGGTYNTGTVFKLTKSGNSWTLQTIWNFGGTETDGLNPIGDLFMDSTGAIYGTTEAGPAGGSNDGTVFKLTQSGGVWSETVLYGFEGYSDGERPNAGLVMDSSGALYGTTLLGGSSRNGTGVGTVFKLQPNGATWTETVLHAFGNGSDGYSPVYSPLLLAANGALYGATMEGGTHNFGTVYELSSSSGTWKEKILHNFLSNASDGGSPAGGLITGTSGAMFGTTLSGGSGGTVYSLTKSNGDWVESILYNFDNYSGGVGPIADVTLNKKAGALYGVTSGGGTNYGVAYQFVLP